MFCTGCGTALAASDRFCPQCGRPNPAAGAGPQAGAPPQPTPVPPTFLQQAPGNQPPFAHQGAPNLQQATAQAQQFAGQAEQIAGRAGQFLQGAQQRLAEQTFVQQAAAKLDQIAIPGLQSGTGTTTRDYIWSAIALLITVLGVWKAPLLHLILALAVGATAVLLGIRTGVSPVWRALAFTLAGGLVAFAIPADPILLTGIALSVRGGWGIVKELFPAEGPHLVGTRAKLLWSGMGIAALGLCFQWTSRESSTWSNYNWSDNSITYYYSYWGGESSVQYIFCLIGIGLILYFRQGKRFTFGWQVGLTLLVWPLALVWMQGLTNYWGLGLLIFTVGSAIALKGLLGDRMPWPKQLN